MTCNYTKVFSLICLTRHFLNLFLPTIILGLKLHYNDTFSVLYDYFSIAILWGCKDVKAKVNNLRQAINVN